MSKGQATREAIVARAFAIATVAGLEGLTIGRLAEELTLSKSGVFAHFGSKEALQLAVIEEASRQFIQEVMVPALRARRGEPRVRALFERWMRWGSRPGGCFFIPAVAELDDRPGPGRDALIRSQRDLLDAVATAVRIAIAEGHFRADLDPDQFAFEAYGIILGTHLFQHFLRTPDALARTQRAFDSLIAGAARPR
jgi:AcrR family transcriptional regulator